MNYIFLKCQINKEKNIIRRFDISLNFFNFFIVLSLTHYQEVKNINEREVGRKLGENNKLLVISVTLSVG